MLQEIADYIGFSKGATEWAFSFAIFFLGMSAALLGNVVDHLRQERKTDSALRLAHHLLHYDRISLGIGEVDWEIDMAIQKFGGNPRTGYRYTAHFSFKGETEMEKERYEEIFNGKE